MGNNFTFFKRGLNHGESARKLGCPLENNLSPIFKLEIRESDSELMS